MAGERAVGPGSGWGWSWRVSLIVGLLGLLALAAQAAPIQWTGNTGGAWVTLFVDGQKATGGITAQLPDGFAEMELSGTGGGNGYRGTLQGHARKSGATFPVTGEWDATLGTDAVIKFTVQARGRQPRSRETQLTKSPGYSMLRCAFLRGSATRTPKGQSAKLSLKLNDPLALGDTIETAADSGALVVLGDRSVVMMQEKTRVVVPDIPDNQHGVQNTKVGAGKVWFAVKKVQDRGKFEVETDEAVAAVRGTEFTVEVGEDGETAITTAEGEVAITDSARRRPMCPCRAGMRWGIGPRRTRKAGFWGASKAHDLRQTVAQWGPMLLQADQQWPLRRQGKAEFWQDRFIAQQDGSGGENRGSIDPPRRGPGGRRAQQPGRFPGPGRRGGR
jgi:hypothetical protein